MSFKFSLIFVISVFLCPKCDLVCQETDPSELLKRQANLSELKRSFLEPQPKSSGISEWNKRLASSPAYCPRLNDMTMIEPLLPSQDVRWIVGSGNSPHACPSVQFSQISSARSLVQSIEVTLRWLVLLWNVRACCHFQFYVNASEDRM